MISLWKFFKIPTIKLPYTKNAKIKEQNCNYIFIKYVSF